MISQLAAAGIRVPGGFATTADAFREFLQQDELGARIEDAISASSTSTTSRALAAAGATIRGWIAEAPLPAALLTRHRARVSSGWSNGADATAFAVRSSATAEDLPDASFAGQQETFLNISGFDNVLQAIPQVFASLYNDRAIAYRVHQGFAHADVALSAGVQRMVRSDLGARRRACSRSTPNPASTTSCSSRRPTASARRSCRAR